MNVLCALTSCVLTGLLLVSSQKLPIWSDVQEIQEKTARFLFNIPKDEIFYDTKVLPEEHQVSAFLYQGEIKLFFFLNENEGNPLSVTVTPCTSSLRWSVRFRPGPSDTAEVGTGGFDNRSSTNDVLQEFSGATLQTYGTVHARRGLYIVEVEPIQQETYVHFYASARDHNPVRVPVKPKIRVFKKRRGKRMMVKWGASSVDPHLTHYCLVVNTRRDYNTLCEALGDRYGVIPPGGPTEAGPDYTRDRLDVHKNEIATKYTKVNNSQKIYEDIVVGCVGRKTKYTVCDLEKGKVYYFNVFTVNKATNLTFPYVQTTLKYDKKRQTVLKDRSSLNVNLKKEDGRIVLKYKLRRPTSSLLFYVMPCGGSVEITLFKNRKVLINSKIVESYKRLVIKNPEKGKYLLSVSGTEKKLERLRNVEVFATRKPNAYPLPALPSETRVKEYDSMRTCDSVMVAWLPSPDPRVSQYCTYVREEPRKEKMYFKEPNHCRLEKSLVKDPAFVSMICQERMRKEKGNVITQKISNLKPGQGYIIQIVVKKRGGKSLSYDLLQVTTKSIC